MNMAKVKPLAVVAVVLVLVSACGGSERTPPDSKVLESIVNKNTWKRDAALVAVVQCLVDHKVIPDSGMGEKSWLRNGAVIPSAELASWAGEHSDTVYAGKKVARMGG